MTEDLIERARGLAVAGGRRLLGLTGPPGAGKSTLALQLCEELGTLAARVPLDGFHLSNHVLATLGLAQRKGAPQTFDVGGFLALLGRLRDNREPVVYAPDFFRDIEEAIAGAIPVHQGTPLVIVEGNYLLVDEDPWSGVRSYLDEVWYLDLNDAVRLDRLVARHRAGGRTAAQAQSWIASNDELNAVTVGKYRDRADLVVPMLGERTAHDPS